MAGVSSVLVALVSLALLVLGTVACVSVIRLSVHVRSGGRRYVIHASDDESMDEQEEAPYRPRRRPTSL